MPHGLAEEVHSHIANGAFAHAEQQCKLRPSLHGIRRSGRLQEVGRGFAAVEKAMEDALQRRPLDYSVKVEFLSVIATHFH